MKLRKSLYLSLIAMLTGMNSTFATNCEMTDEEAEKIINIIITDDLIRTNLKNLETVTNLNNLNEKEKLELDRILHVAHKALCTIKPMI